MDNSFPHEPADLLQKRLRFRSTHRGCKEMDLVLGTFAEAHLPGLSGGQLIAYAHLLDENDADIWDWLMGRTSPAREEYAPLLARMIAQAQPV